MIDGQQPTEHILQYFSFAHLPPHLAAISAPFAYLAKQTIMTLPRNPERTVALRKLLESKDAAVRAAITVDPQQSAHMVGQSHAESMLNPDDR